MSLIQPVLVLDTSHGSVVTFLQIGTSRMEAEMEAEFIIHAKPEDVVIHQMAILMLEADALDITVPALLEGREVHSTDCTCHTTE